MLVKLIELLNVDLAERVPGAELVDFVVNLVVDPGLVVVDGVVFDGGPGQIWFQAVDHLYLLEVNDDASLCTAGNIVNSVGLHCYLNRIHRRHEWHLGVPARLRGALQQGTTSEVNTEVALGHLVQPAPRSCAHQD